MQRWSSKTNLHALLLITENANQHTHPLRSNSLEMRGRNSCWLLESGGYIILQMKSPTVFFHCQEKKPVPCLRYVLESIRGKNPWSWCFCFLCLFSSLAVLTEGLTQQGQKSVVSIKGKMPFSWSFSLQLHVTYVSWVVKYSYIMLLFKFLLDFTRKCKTAIEIGTLFDDIWDNFLLFNIQKRTITSIPKVLLLIS